MFSVYCATVAAEVLLGPTDIEAVLSSGGELAMEYRCSCGERGIWKRGKGRPQAHTQAHTEAANPARAEAMAS